MSTPGKTSGFPIQLAGKPQKADLVLRKTISVDKTLPKKGGKAPQALTIM